MRRTLTRALCSFAGLATALVSSGPGTASATGELPLRTVLASGRVPGMHWDRLDDVRGALYALYADREWRPLWITEAGWNEPARRVIEALQGAGAFGLAATDYDSGTALLQGVPGVGPTRRAQQELALSANITRVLRALSQGRVDPSPWFPTLGKRTEFDVAGAIRSLAGGADPDSLLRVLQPADAGYQGLLLALRRLRREDARPPRLPARVEPGDSLPDGAALARWLTVLGVLSTDDTSDVDHYSAALVAAVSRVQAGHALAPDGRIGPATRAQLLRPLRERIRQIELSLERRRWLRAPVGMPWIEVNIPAQALTAWLPVQRGDSAAVEMRVIIGKLPRNRTPMLATVATGIEFNPPWRVPTRIALAEVVPRLRRDPSRMKREGFTIFQGNRNLGPNAGLLGRVGRDVELRQLPGPQNPLGRIKVVMPNSADVYLHDTPGRTLFVQPLRTFSHGCVRVADAEALAAFVLGQGGLVRSDWEGNLVDRVTVAVEPGIRIPVRLTYLTAVASPSGRVVFHADLYGADRQLDRALRLGYPYRRAGRLAP